LRSLSTDIIARLPEMFTEMVSCDQPGLSSSQLQAMVQAERPHLLPGSRDELVNFLRTTLDKRRSGVVGREEFLTSWNKAAEVIFAQLRKTPTQGMKCIIL